ncbi:MAG: DUF2167 domain-containing protein [Burkholderiales bacterium]|nr:DUF2167 domain-containing protein [Burkholderiales bacterium]
MRMRYLAIVVSMLLACSAAQAEGGKYSPHKGPFAQEISGVAHLDVYPHYLTLDTGDTSRLMEEMHNPGVTGAYYLAPDNEDWFAIFEHEETGHVKDNDSIDANAVLEQIKAGTAESNKERRARGWSELNIIGWRVEPHYETDTRRLSWATLNESDGKQAINYTTKILGRTGVVTVTLVTSPDKLDRAVADLKQQLDGFKFDAGQSYTEFKDGDKVAEYGLTGLIVGGAAAVAAKSGFFKWIGAMLVAGWKIVAGVVMAGVAAIKNLFKKKSA